MPGPSWTARASCGPPPPTSNRCCWPTAATPTTRTGATRPGSSSDHAGCPPLLATTTEDGFRHRLWAVTDPAEIAAVDADLAPPPGADRRRPPPLGHLSAAARRTAPAHHAGAVGPRPGPAGRHRPLSAAGPRDPPSPAPAAGGRRRWPRYGTPSASSRSTARCQGRWTRWRTRASGREQRLPARPATDGFHLLTRPDDRTCRRTRPGRPPADLAPARRDRPAQRAHRPALAGAGRTRAHRLRPRQPTRPSTRPNGWAGPRC